MTYLTCPQKGEGVLATVVKMSLNKFTLPHLRRLRTLQYKGVHVLLKNGKEIKDKEVDGKIVTAADILQEVIDFLHFIPAGWIVFEAEEVLETVTVRKGEEAEMVTAMVRAHQVITYSSSIDVELDSGLTVTISGEDGGRRTTRSRRNPVLEFFRGIEVKLPSGRTLKDWTCLCVLSPPKKEKRQQVPATLTDEEIADLTDGLLPKKEEETAEEPGDDNTGDFF